MKVLICCSRLRPSEGPRYPVASQIPGAEIENTYSTPRDLELILQNPTDALSKRHVEDLTATC